MFSDAMAAFLEEKKISGDVTRKLFHYIEDEEFDTDSIQMDINIRSASKGNIAIVMNNDRLMIMMNTFIQNSNS